MPSFRFQIQQTGVIDVAGHDVELPDAQAAWTEAVGMCRDLSRDLIAETASNSEWRLEVTNAAGILIFQFSFTVKALPPP